MLEHQYGATLLAGLLTGDPMPELGDDATPVEVRFQASPVSAVDDLLITGLDRVLPTVAPEPLIERVERGRQAGIRW